MHAWNIAVEIFSLFHEAAPFSGFNILSKAMVVD